MKIVEDNEKHVFELRGRMVFEAEGLLDALKKLSQHFGELAEGGDGIPMLGGTNIKCSRKGGKSISV